MNLFKRVICNICERRFSSDEELMSHKEIFHGEQQYDCKQCNQYFASMDEMRTHLQREHSYKN